MTMYLNFVAKARLLRVVFVDAPMEMDDTTSRIAARKPSVTMTRKKDDKLNRIDSSLYNRVSLNNLTPGVMFYRECSVLIFPAVEKEIEIDPKNAKTCEQFRMKNNQKPIKPTDPSRRKMLSPWRDFQTLQPIFCHFSLFL